MKFATKLSLGCITLLSCALCAAGLVLTGKSFSGSLETTRATLQAQQTKEKYTLERSVYAAAEANTPFSSQSLIENYTLATAAQQYAEQTADLTSSMALWVNGTYTLYSNLPAAIPRAKQQQAVAGGAEHWQLFDADGGWYMLLSQPLNLPGVQADLLCAYDVTSIFATRNAQLRAWLAASVILLMLGSGAAVLFSRRITRPLTVLQSASKKIAAGQYAERTRVQTNDEIGALSRSFDAMAAAVENQITAMEETLQSQKDFIAAFTHEVKTPMTAMLGYADLMRAAPDDVELQRESANYIYHETRRLEELSRRLLALMGLDNANRLTLEPATDHSLLTQVVRSLPHGSTPVPRIIACGCTVCVDRALWVDMLRNLTINAQHACKGISGASITLYCQQQGSMAFFRVADTGCGIPAADLPRVTEAFYMVDKSRSRADGGSGIGLALCSRIAQAHGTQLKIESTENAGTTVTAALPILCPDVLPSGFSASDTDVKEKPL